MSIEVSEVILKGPDFSREDLSGAYGPPKPPDPPYPKGTPEFFLMVVFPDGLEISILLPQDEKYIISVLKPEMESIYRIYGEEGIDCVEAGIGRMGDEPYTAPFQTVTRTAFNTSKREILDLAEAICNDMEVKARLVALDRLNDSIDEIISETRRYLSCTNAESYLKTNPSACEFKDYSESSEANGMIAGLVEIRDLKLQLKKNCDKFTEKMENLIKNGDLDTRAATLPHGSMDMLYYKRPELYKANVDVKTTEHELTSAIVKYSAKYPIIYRLINVQTLPDYPPGTSYFLNAPRGLAQGELFGHFKMDIINTLSAAYLSAVKLKKEIAGSPKLIWDYRPLIEATLDSLDEDNMSFYSRAVEERLKKKTFKDWVDIASLLSVGLDFAAVVTSPAPPVAVTLKVISTALSVAPVLLESYDKYNKGIAAKASLDPSKCLSGEPSWGFFTVNAALQVLSMRYGFLAKYSLIVSLSGMETKEDK